MAIRPADQPQHVPDHRLIAGDDRAGERRLQFGNDAEYGDIGAADEIRIRVGPCRLRGARAPERRRRRAIGVAAGEREAFGVEHLEATPAQECRLVLGRARVVRREQDDPTCRERIEGAPDGGDRGRPARSSGPRERRLDLLLAGLAALHRICGAMEGDDRAARIDERARRLRDARQEHVRRDVMAARHTQARDMRLDAARKGGDHLLLDHAVRGRDDQPDPGRRGHACLSRKPARSRRPITSSQKYGSSSR